MASISDKRIDFFDYLRALAIVMVVIAHHRLENLQGGSVGVAVFFCLSGFLITTLLLKIDTLNASSIRKFIIRRWMRVYPAYLVTLVLILVLLGTKNHLSFYRYVDALPGLALFATLPKDWVGMGVGVFWTLHVEFWFYVSMPLLMLLVGRGKGLAFVMGGLVVTAIGLKYAVIVEHADIWAWSPIQLFLWSDTLLYGSIIALLAHYRLIQAPRWLCLLLIVLCVAAIEAIALYVPNTDHFLWLTESAVTSFLTAIIIGAFIADPIDIEFAPLAWLGRISYAIYLLHAIPIDFGWDVWPLRFPQIGRLLGVTLVVLMLHYWVERPAIRLGRRWTPDHAANKRAETLQRQSA